MKENFRKYHLRLMQNQKILLILPMMLWAFVSFSQQQVTDKKDQKASQRLTKEAQQALKKEKFTSAEADYRKAIALDPNNQTAKYNLGNAYYNNNKNDEALHRYKQAAKNATSKEDRHRALHNLGNAFMNKKMYREAVEAYKDALRNNPKDDETRYNLALAKDLLDKNPPPPEDENQDDQNQDQDDNQDQNQDKNQDQNQDKNDDSGDDDKEDKDKGDDKQDQDKQEGDDKEDKGNPEDDGEQEQPQQPQRQPGQLSPEQVQSLLDAMENEEKRVQDKMNLEKQKGSKVKSDKNW